MPDQIYHKKPTPERDNIFFNVTQESENFSIIWSEKERDESCVANKEDLLDETDGFKYSTSMLILIRFCILNEKYETNQRSDRLENQQISNGLSSTDLVIAE